MAITGTFLANFDQFNGAVEGAGAKLRAFEGDSTKVDTSIKTMGESATRSTGLLGGMATQLAGMFTVGAVIAFGNEVLQAGDHIQKMADQTGLGTGEIQKLQYIAGQSGTSIESLVGAVQNLQQRLGDDDAGAVGAMKKLGIQADTFNKLGTYDQMTTLADGIRQIKDPTEQASVAADLFGKTWKEILPAIKSGMKDVGDQAPIMSGATVKALDAIGDAQTRAKAQAIAWGGSTVLAIEGMGFALGDWLSKFNPEHFGVATSTILKLQGQLNDPDGLKGALAALPPLTPPIVEGLKAIGVSVTDEKAAWDAMAASSKAAHEAARQFAADTRAWVADETKAQQLYAALEEMLHQTALGHQKAEAAGKAAQLTATNQLTIAAFQADQKIAADLAALIKKLASDTVTTVVTASGAIVTLVNGVGPALDAMASKADATLDHVKQQAAAATQYSMVGGTQLDAAGFDAYYKTPAGIAEMIRNGGKRYYAGGGPPRAMGGPVSAGAPYVVGERGPELFVPSGNGSILPNGAGGTTINNFYITQPLGSPDAIARALQETARSRGIRL